MGCLKLARLSNSFNEHEGKWEMEKDTFDLKDLTEDFWKKVVYFEITPTSGLGGPGALWMVTEDKEKYYLGFEDLPFSEYKLAENLHPMFTKTDKIENGHYKYAIENDDWHYLPGLIAFVRGDIYDKFVKVASNEELVKEKILFGYENMPDIVGLAIGTESLERINYIRSVRAQEEKARWLKELDDEHERNKLLPKHIIWKPMHVNNVKDSPIIGEYALIVSSKEEKLVAQKFTIAFQYHMIEPIMIELYKEPECYILFEKYYYDFYGPIDYPSSDNKWLNSEDNSNTSARKRAYFDWFSLDDGDMEDYGRFVRCFKTMDEAKEYALCFANENLHRVGNRHTMVTHIDPKEDHERRIERYEAYQAYRKYYKEIMDVVVNYDGYPSNACGGGGYLSSAILERVPQITERQLMFFWRDVPRVLEKRTQDVIEMERQKSLKTLQDLVQMIKEESGG